MFFKPASPDIGSQPADTYDFNIFIMPIGLIFCDIFGGLFSLEKLFQDAQIYVVLLYIRQLLMPF